MDQHHTPWSIPFILEYREYYGIVFYDGSLRQELKTGIVGGKGQEIIVVFLHFLGIFILVSLELLFSCGVNRLLFELDIGSTLITKMNFLHMEI